MLCILWDMLLGQIYNYFYPYVIYHNHMRGEPVLGGPCVSVLNEPSLNTPPAVSLSGRFGLDELVVEENGRRLGRRVVDTRG